MFPGSQPKAAVLFPHGRSAEVSREPTQLTFPFRSRVVQTLSRDELELPQDRSTDDLLINENAEAQDCRDSLLQVHPFNPAQSLTILDNDICYVGRDRSCQLRIFDRSVSRQHAVIRSADDGWQIMDLGSTNGTKINDQSVTHAVLRQGDRIQLGKFIFKYLSSRHVERQYHDAISARIQQDDMLNVMNKRVFLERFARSFQQAVYQNNPLTIAMLDLDHFKEVNDQFGHQVGDEVLRECVQRIQAVVPENATLARYGGEEFVLMFEGSRHLDTVPFAEEILRVISSTAIETAAGPVSVTLSIGLADTNQLDASQDRDGTALLNLADSRLYQSKRQGRNQITR